MAQIKTVTTTSGENTITFDSFYPYIWIRNSGDNDITAANYSGAQAGDENTVSIKAGEVAMIQAKTENVYIIGATTAEIHAQGFAECPFKRGLGGGEQISVESLSVTTNGTYTAPTGTAYSPVVVDVQEQPWQPLEDGYSNFWFELTDDTLSPWLNFSAKNNDATIDWGDGSGEVALDTLTPTHTYSKAGKYVVKVKGVTGIAAQGYIPYTAYSDILTHFELASDVTVIANTSFRGAQNLTSFTMTDYITTIGTTAFAYCPRIKGKVIFPPIEIPTSICLICTSINEIEFKEGTSSIGNTTFFYNTALVKITIPSTVTSIGQAAFNSCVSLSEIHVKATTPPTLSTNVFGSLPINYVIYVPVGYGETYKAASGWSAYSDHILEEGQTPNRAMLSRLAKEAKAIEESGEEMSR